MIANYTELQDAVGRWLYRDDLATVIPDFITLAETRLNRDLMLRKQETMATGTLTDETIAIPADLSTLQRIVVEANGKDNELVYRAPQDTTLFSSSDVPRYFTEINQGYIVSPKPAGNYPYRVYYTANFPALSNAVATNWLLTNAPDLYLAAAVLHGWIYLQDEQRVGLWETAYQKALAALMEQDARSQFPGESTMIIRSDSSVF